VSIFYGVCPGTIDDLQYRLLEESRKVVSDVMEGADDAHDIEADAVKQNHSDDRVILRRSTIWWG